MRKHLQKKRFKKTRGAFSPVYANVGLGVDKSKIGYLREDGGGC